MDNRIAKKFIAVEREIHFDRTSTELEEFFGTFALKGRYEDGILAHKLTIS